MSRKCRSRSLNCPVQAILDPRTSQKIFELARDQQIELDDQTDSEEDVSAAAFTRLQQAHTRDLDGSDDEDVEYAADEDADHAEELLVRPLVDSFNFRSRCAEDFILQEIDEEDLQTLDNLLPPDGGERKTLADLIFAKLESGETGDVSVIKKSRQGKCSGSTAHPEYFSY